MAPVEDETGCGRFALLALTLNPRVWLVVSPLGLVRVGTHELRPLAGTATHFHESSHAITGWIETRGLVPGRYMLQTLMQGAQGEVDTVVQSVTVQPVQRMGFAPCHVTEVLWPLHRWGVA